VTRVANAVANAASRFAVRSVCSVSKRVGGFGTSATALYSARPLNRPAASTEDVAKKLYYCRCVVCL